MKVVVQPEKIHISVEDTGPGIAEHELEYIFDPFIQADTGQQNQQEGTGLGLATVRRIVEQHGGMIEVSSAEGSGACFRVLLACMEVGS